MNKKFGILAILSNSEERFLGSFEDHYEKSSFKE